MPQLDSSSSNAELASIYQQLSQPPLPGQVEEHIDLCHRALELVGAESQSEARASLQSKLGGLYARSQGSDRSRNFEQAITAYQAALQYYTTRDYPGEWATLQAKLGNVYRQRLQGDAGENLGLAQRCYQAALSIFTPAAYPEEHQTLQISLREIRDDLTRVRGPQAPMPSMLIPQNQPVVPRREIPAVMPPAQPEVRIEETITEVDREVVEISGTVHQRGPGIEKTTHTRQKVSNDLSVACLALSLVANAFVIFPVAFSSFVREDRQLVCFQPFIVLGSFAGIIGLIIGAGSLYAGQSKTTTIIGLGLSVLAVLIGTTAFIVLTRP